MHLLTRFNNKDTETDSIVHSFIHRNNVAETIKLPVYSTKFQMRGAKKTIACLSMNEKTNVTVFSLTKTRPVSILAVQVFNETDN